MFTVCSSRSYSTPAECRVAIRRTNLTEETIDGEYAAAWTIKEKAKVGMMSGRTALMVCLATILGFAFTDVLVGDQPAALAALVEMAITRMRSDCGAICLTRLSRRRWRTQPDCRHERAESGLHGSRRRPEGRLRTVSG